MKSFFLITFAFGILLAQAPAGKVEFEVVSVRAAPPVAKESEVSFGIHVDGAQARIASVSIKDLVAMAYRTKTYQVAGPDWTGTDHFNVTGKMPAGSTSDQVPEMLQ